MRALCLASSLLVAGCLYDDAYVCHQDTSCVGSDRKGVCVPSGFAESYCAVMDHACASGLRWDRTADPTLASTCVLATVDLNAIYGIGPADLFAVGNGGLILHSSDGANWTQPTSGTTNDLFAVWGISKGPIFAVGGGTSPVIVTSNDDGTTWTPVQIMGSAGGLTGIWGTGSGDVYAVGGPFVVASHDGGLTWQPSMQMNVALTSVWGSAADDVYASGRNGAIVHSTDRGSTWQPLMSGTTHSFWSVWGADANDVFVVGERGEIRHSVDHGATWTAIGSGTIEELRSINGAGQDFYIAGQATLLHSATAGASWSPLDARNAYFNGVWASPAASYAVGRVGAFLRVQ